LLLSVVPSTMLYMSQIAWHRMGNESWNSKRAKAVKAYPLHYSSIYEEELEKIMKSSGRTAAVQTKFKPLYSRPKLLPL
jgi:hypothetical protein